MKVTLTAPVMFRGTRLEPGATPDVDAECAERWARKGWIEKPKSKDSGKTEPKGSKNDDDSGKSSKPEGAKAEKPKAAKPAKKPSR